MWVISLFNPYYHVYSVMCLTHEWSTNRESLTPACSGARLRTEDNKHGASVTSFSLQRSLCPEDLYLTVYLQYKPNELYLKNKIKQWFINLN